MQTDLPWTGVKRWRNGHIGTDAQLPFYASLFTFLLWNLVTVGLIATQWRGIQRAYHKLQLQNLDSIDPVLFLPLLLLLNLLLLPQLIRTGMHWRRYGRSFLTLDPYPGAIGGQVGGYLTLPLRFQPGMNVDVQINCIKVRTQRDHGQSGPTRMDSVLWRTRAAAEIMPDARGAQVRFVADVEDGLPVSSVQRLGERVYWAVRIQLPGAGYDQTFRIPVFTKSGRGTSSLRIKEDLSSPAGSAQRGDSPVSSTAPLISETADGVNIRYPAGRGGVIGPVLVAIGIISCAVAVFMGYQFSTGLQSESMSYFAAVVDLLLLSGATVLAGALTLGGLYISTNTLSVELRGDWLKTERRVFGRVFSKLLPTSRIVGFVKEVSSQTGQGTLARINYSISAINSDGRKIAVGDGIPGQDAADSLLDLFNKHAQVVSPEQQDTLRPETRMPAWAPYLVLAVKAFGGLVLVAVIVAFAVDFMAF